MKTKSPFDLALNYLTYKPRSEKEIRDYLIKKKFRKDVIEETVKKLKEYHYIDDMNYVLQVYEFNKNGKRNGKRKLLFSLKNKGISESDLDLLNEKLTDFEEEENCQFHFNKLLKLTEGIPYQKRVRKILSNLQAKGFNYSLINEFLDQIPKDETIDFEQLEIYFQKAKRRYENKGLERRELKNKIIQNLMNKGYSYSNIKDYLDEKGDFN